MLIINHSVVNFSLMPLDSYVVESHSLTILGIAGVVSIASRFLQLHTTGLEVNLVFLDKLSTKAKELSLPCYLTHIWRRKKWIHMFCK